MAEQGSGKRSTSISRFLVGGSLGIAFGVVLANTLPNESAGTVYLGFLAILLSGIAVHECGHALATIFVRFKLVSISIGPLALQLVSRRIRLRRSGLALGGLTMAVPQGTENLRERFMVMIAAGPATSIIAGVTAIAVGRAIRSSSWGGWCSAWGYGSLLLAVLSLIPNRKFYYSDGARFALLMRNTPSAERNCAMLALSAAASAGTRPRDWNSEILHAACVGPDDGSGDGLRAALFGYEYAMDSRKFDEAGKFLNLAIASIDKCPPQTKAGLALDAAFFHSMVNSDAGAAREWLIRSNTKLVQDRYAVLMVEAAVLSVEGKILEAKRKATASRAVLAHATLAGFARAAEDWLNDIEARCGARAIATSTEH